MGCWHPPATPRRLTDTAQSTVGVSRALGVSPDLRVFGVQDAFLRRMVVAAAVPLDFSGDGAPPRWVWQSWRGCSLRALLVLGTYSARSALLAASGGLGRDGEACGWAQR